MDLWGRRGRTGRSRLRLRSERGSGTVLAAGGVFVLLTMASAVLLVAQSAVAADQAATAADLAALAAADAARGIIPGEPCEVAQAVVRKHDATLVGCAVEGADQDIVDITTRIALPGPWGAATGRARAGPPP